MSYEHTTPNEFATPYPDWSEYPLPVNHEESALASTDPHFQYGNYQEGSYCYAAGAGKSLPSWPSIYELIKLSSPYSGYPASEHGYG